jgi:type I restriction enzyme S subunit
MSNWPTKTLGEVCEVFDDGDWIESKDQSPSGVRLIQTGNVGDGVFKDRSDKARFISESTFSRLRCTEIFPGDLLVSRLPDPVGRACLIPDTGSKMITAVDCTIMRPRKDIMSPQFLVSSTQTSSYREQVRAKITGTTRDRISRSHLAEVQVVVPPLKEQKRIVELLEAADVCVTELTTCYEKARIHANNLFSSAVRDALQGNLDWTVKTLGEVARWGSGGTPQSGVAKYYDGDIPWCVIGDLTEGDVWSTQKLITEEGLLNSSAKIVDVGAVLIAMYGASIGRTGVVRTRMATNQAIAFAYAHQEIVHSEFLLMFLQSQKQSFIEAGQGAAQPNISQLVLKEWPISLPPLDEQKQIVARLDSMRAKTSEMAAAYDAKLTAAKNLRQSILEAAFAGDL